LNKLSDIIFLGGGGHSLSCCDVLNQNKNFNLIGFIDANKNALLSESGYEWLGSDNNMQEAIQKYKNIFISIGHMKTADKRVFLYEKSKKIGGVFPILKSNFSYISPTAFIEEGSLIMHGAVINAKAHISKNCIINSNSVIEHGVTIGNHVHIAPSAIILGDVKIGDECFIGAGAIIREGVTIGKRTVIKAREIVIHDKNK
jgi:sugar O-acyltransferase (sialic acid O-acetyltransferase NeuD family)